MIRAIGKVRWVARGCEVRAEDTDELLCVAKSDGLAKLIALAPRMLALSNARWSAGQLGRLNGGQDSTAEQIDVMLTPIGGAPAWTVTEGETCELAGVK